MKKYIGILLVAMLLLVQFSPALAQVQNSFPKNQTNTEREALIQKLMQQIIVLQQLLEKTKNQNQPSSPSTSSVWQSSPTAVVNNKGPQKNAMSCEGGADSNLSNGLLACYGLHDYGGEFGDDQATCGGLDPDYEKRVPTGCVIEAPVCKSNRAIASEYYRTTNLSTNKIAELARNFKATEVAVRDQLIKVWEYRCTDKPLTGLGSIVDQTKIKNTFLGLNKDWSFVDNASDILVVGAYTGSDKDGSIQVTIADANPNSLLVLSAYDPVTWKLSGAALKNIKAIFVTGYGNQRIEGLPTGVKVTSAVFESGQVNDFFIVYERDSVEYYELVNYLRAKTGFTPYLFFSGYQLTNVKVSLKG